MNLQTIPDCIPESPLVLFVGFNPGLLSGRTGFPFAHKTNKFWNVLYLAGFTDRLYNYWEVKELLKFGYGFTNIVQRTTRTAQQITNGEYREGSELLRLKIQFYGPKFICFVGKGVYLKFMRENRAQWGFQEFRNPKMFVAPSTSGLVRMTTQEMVQIYKKLRERLE